ncbi:MAG: hypothetical protein BAJALOKI1v1_130025 [Promethearchaeota archaeon]|nr:MAG: hypothetical protein BAJALOKI1v1_130025 [Candidatus Lokiarchaeota archaeon]
MSNRLLSQFNEVISREWLTEVIEEPVEPLNTREMFELAYHTENSVQTRCIWLKLVQEFKEGSQAILYSNNKTFSLIEIVNDNDLKIQNFYNDDKNSTRLNECTLPLLLQRKLRFNKKEKDLKSQILKTILVERKIDECANLTMTKDINRKIYFAIGDARESAAVVPLFMQAEGASLVQLALNKWMATAQNLPPEETFPEGRVPGLLKNLMQIKKWTLKLVDSHLDRE